MCIVYVATAANSETQVIFTKWSDNKEQNVSVPSEVKAAQSDNGPAPSNDEVDLHVPMPVPSDNKPVQSDNVVCTEKHDPVQSEDGSTPSDDKMKETAHMQVKKTETETNETSQVGVVIDKTTPPKDQSDCAWDVVNPISLITECPVREEPSHIEHEELIVEDIEINDTPPQEPEHPPTNIQPQV